MAKCKTCGQVKAVVFSLLDAVQSLLEADQGAAAGRGGFLSELYRLRLQATVAKTIADLAETEAKYGPDT